MRRDPHRVEPPPWTEFADAKHLLASYLEALPATALPTCRKLADPSDAQLADPQFELDAKLEVKSAFAAAGARLLEGSPE